MPHRWGVFWAVLDPVIGSEQGGLRPVLVISADEVNQSLPIVTVVPFTSFREGRKVYPTEVFLKKESTGLPRDSIAMAHQIRTISKDRLREPCGQVEEPNLRKQIERALMKHLGLVWI